MCYYVGIDELLRKQAEDETKAQWPYGEKQFPLFQMTNAMALPEIPVITSQHMSEMRAYHWKFIAPWAKTIQQVKETKMWAANVIIEEAEQKKLFKSIVDTQRSIAIFSHFFEWRHEGKRKIKYKIRLPDGNPLYMPGFYSKSTVENEEYLSFNVATMEAQGIMKHIHNTKLRQPVVLDWATAKAWLDESIPFGVAREIATSKNKALEFVGEVIEDPPKKTEKKPKQQELF